MDDRLSLIIRNHAHAQVSADGQLKQPFWEILRVIQPRVYLVKIGDQLAVLKLEDERLYMDSAWNELGIGLIINEYLSEFPCFIRTYTGFRASLPYEDKPGIYDGPPEIMGNYVLTEYIPGVDLCDYLLTTTDNHWPTIYYLLKIVQRFNYYTQFVHNDLHLFNVILRPTPGMYALPGTGRGVYLSHLPVIIDYGRSNILIYGPQSSRYLIHPGGTSKLDEIYILFSYFMALGRPSDFPLAEYFREDQIQTYTAFPEDGVQQIINHFGDPSQDYITPLTRRSLQEIPVEGYSLNLPSPEIVQSLTTEHRRRALYKDLDRLYNDFYNQPTACGFSQLKDVYLELVDLTTDNSLDDFQWIADYHVDLD